MKSILSFAKSMTTIIQDNCLHYIFACITYIFVKCYITRNKKIDFTVLFVAKIFAISCERDIFKFTRIYCSVGLQFDYLGAR